MFGISILMLNAQTKLLFTHCRFFDQNAHKWNYQKKTSIERSTHPLSYDPPFPRIHITLLYSHSIPLNTHPISTQLIFFFSDSSHSSPTLLVTHLSFFFSLIHHTSSLSHSSLIPKSYVILEQWPSKWWFSIILVGMRYAFIFFSIAEGVVVNCSTSSGWTNLNHSAAQGPTFLDFFSYWGLNIFFLDTQDRTL